MFGLSFVREYQILALVTTSGLLTHTSVMDIKKREIPIYLYLIATPIILIGQIATKTPIIPQLVAMLVMFVFYFVQALYSEGGGDIIMMSFLGLTLGLYPCLGAIILSFPFTFLYIGYKVFFKKNKVSEILKASYPVAPFITLGFISYLILSYFLAI